MILKFGQLATPPIMSHKVGSPEWREEFARKREDLIASLRSAVGADTEVVSWLRDGSFTFGWAFEQGHTGHPFQQEGDFNYAASYLRHMINQGFRVAAGIAYNGPQALVCLKAWEDAEPSWSEDFVPDAVIRSHQSSTDEHP
jgi:hypothetical protein